MPTKIEFEKAARLAVRNIINHGDTDIFPFPFERFVFSDNTEDVVALLTQYNDNFYDFLSRYSPLNVSSLSPVSYFGFRWATQIDYIWNAYLLACVLILSEKIEQSRISISSDYVFSYRIKIDDQSASLFQQDVGFRSFLTESLKISHDYKFVVLCDISEFYPRLGHHRLENALQQVDSSSDYSRKIMLFLQNFSRTNSFGLPVGGPAARILSELTINQIDRLLLAKGIRFTRFADDYHLFSNTREDAYQNLIFLSEKLSFNQGLTLQKSKTRIMSTAEFQATTPTTFVESDVRDPDNSDLDTDVRERLMSFSLRFDPYSPTKDDDYERLKDEISKYDILSILKSELAKTRVHTSLVRKLIRSITFMDEGVQSDAILSILNNSDVLYPIFSSVLLTIDQLIPKLKDEIRSIIRQKIISLISDETHVLRVELHLSYAVRVLRHFHDPEVTYILQKIYDDRNSPIIRRDIILIMAEWCEWYWISDIRNNFRQLSSPERRAFIVASYILKDEGKHWRDHIQSELSPYEILIKKWAGSKANMKGWRIST